MAVNISLGTNLRLKNVNNNSYTDISLCFNINDISRNQITNYKKSEVSLIFNKIQTSFYSDLICGNIGFKQSGVDIGSLCLPTSYLFSNSTGSVNIPENVQFIYFLLQGPGGDGSFANNSPARDGTQGGSGSLMFGYLDTSINAATSISATSNSTESNLTFTGGTSLTLTAGRGTDGNKNSQNAPGGTNTKSATTGITFIIDSSGNAGINNCQAWDTPSPINNAYQSATSTFVGKNLYPVTSFYTLVQFGFNTVSGNTYTPLSGAINQPYPTYGQGGKGQNPGASSPRDGIIGCVAIWLNAR